MVRTAFLKRLKRIVIGAPRSPLASQQRERMLLVAFLAWIGLGADGLSSANYGPEETFLALAGHNHLALYLAVATALTVFIICLGYIQVIELFPQGGGGYRIASVLLGPRAGLISGSALIVNFILTIAISIASGVDALFSLLPVDWQPWKLPIEIVVTLALLIANLRGVKEVVLVLMPIFLGFLVTHGGLILTGVFDHASRLPSLVPDTLQESRAMIDTVGLPAMLAIVLQAFALGGGTYTGIEAVSNNVHMLKEPRVRTARWTMFYMAVSLSFTAGGLIILYLLWSVAPQEGRTLNAAVFRLILNDVAGESSPILPLVMAATLAFAAGILFVAANTGFLGGPAVLANMAVDRWVPHQFAQFSNRLVTQNGVLLMGLSAVGVLLLTDGRVSVIVVLYSINVFISFVLSFVGLFVHWFDELRQGRPRIGRLSLAALGTIVTGSVLGATLYFKFTQGAWMTVLITGLVIGLCVMIRQYYEDHRRQMAKVDALFAATTPGGPVAEPPPLDPKKPTAVFLIGANVGAGMHTLLTTRKLFGDRFKNYVFLSVGEIDSASFRGEEALKRLDQDVQESLNHFVNYCHRRGLAATAYHSLGADVMAELTRLSDKVLAEFPDCVFLASKLLFQRENLVTRLLHNQTALAMQRELHMRGVPMLILPMRV
ncbi:MAG: APC family permease [Pseudomonadota bacterium]